VTRFLIFIGIATLLLGGVHYYLWARLVRDTALPQPWRLLATVTILVLAVSIPATMFLRRSLGETSFSELILWPAMVWLGMAFLLIVLTASVDLVRLVVWSVNKVAGGAPFDPERRLFIARVGGGIIAALGLAAAGASLRSALARVRVKTVEIPLRRLPAALDGSTIAFISDVHIGQAALGRAWLEQVVADINALRPDVIAIGGDLVDGSVEDLRDAVAPLAELRARHGVYFVTGNHEYYSGAVDWCAHLETLGVRVLRNQRVRVGEGEASYDLAGVDDFNARGMAPGHGADLARALDGQDPARELVLLAHQPRAVYEAADRGVGLQLSGHTHGGQLWPWRYLVYLQQPFVAGFGKLGETQIYVSNGTGFWGPPMRFLAPPEITRVVLRSRPAA
jgi:predicted MPP superfamily phosphohydrolase